MTPFPAVLLWACVTILFLAPFVLLGHIVLIVTKWQHERAASRR